jgi:hypothetical protein
LPVIYPHCYFCTILEGNLILKEHDAAAWLTKDTLDSVKWLPADLSLIEKIKDNDIKNTLGHEISYSDITCPFYLMDNENGIGLYLYSYYKGGSASFGIPY